MKKTYYVSLFNVTHHGRIPCGGWFYTKTRLTNRVEIEATNHTEAIREAFRAFNNPSGAPTDYEVFDGSGLIAMGNSW
jgi:hypothetical protein